MQSFSCCRHRIYLRTIIYRLTKGGLSLNLKPYIVLILILLLQSCQAPSESPPIAPESVFFLVRHAEKADLSDGSPLTEAGRLRAQSLANLLRDAGIERIYSSDFVRTRDTAAPLANDLGLEVILYDPNELNDLKDELVSSPGRHLVVGHSNTTPELSGLLGGEPGPAISDDEYDRLYMLVYRPGVGTSTVIVRFGA
jgi:phosphohistidine phosphatase SixA